jgi:hypothetical protein
MGKRPGEMVRSCKNAALQSRHAAAAKADAAALKTA